jgi:integrase
MKLLHRPHGAAGGGVARLTKTAVDGLKATDRDLWVWDETLPGFGVRARPTGVRTYFVQYRNAAGRSRRLSLGRHGVLTAEQARRLALEKLGAVAGGRDPLAEKQAARAAHAASERPLTIDALADRWLEHQRAMVSKGKLRDRTRREYERQLRAEIRPRLGRRRLADLTPADALALHDALADRPTLANRVVDLLSALWRWAEDQGFVSGPNPCRRVERNEERRRARHLTHAELARLGAALGELASPRGRRPPLVPPRIAALIRLIALTGCRPGEIKTLRWDRIDLGRRVLHLRNAKTGDRDVWLAEPALAVLRGLPSVEGSAFVFPSRHKAREPRPVGEFRKPWKALLEAAQIPQTEPYVFRHTFASEAESLGLSPYLTGELLGHSLRRRDMTRGYVHHVPEDVRRASERVAASIASALSGERAVDIVALPVGD